MPASARPSGAAAGTATTIVPARPYPATCPSSMSRRYASVTTPRARRSSSARTRLAGNREPTDRRPSPIAARICSVSQSARPRAGAPLTSSCRKSEPDMDLSVTLVLDLATGPFCAQSQPGENPNRTSPTVHGNHLPQKKRTASAGSPLEFPSRFGITSAGTTHRLSRANSRMRHAAIRARSASPCHS